MPRRLLAVLMLAALISAAAGSGVSAQLPGLEPQLSDLSDTKPNAPSVWQAQHRTTAAQIAAMLPELDVLWRWDGRRWQPYASVGGRLAPGASNFTVETGDRLWIGNWAPPEPTVAGVIIAEGRRAGVRADRNLLGDPEAEVLITDIGDYL